MIDRVRLIFGAHNAIVEAEDGKVNPLAHVLTQLAYAVCLQLHGDMNFLASSITPKSPHVFVTQRNPMDRRTFAIRSAK